MSTVYIVNKGVHDHSDAKRFGELVYLTEGAINRYGTSNMVREFLPILCNSKPDDYLLPTGLTIMNMIAGGIFVRRHGRLNLLIYKANKNGGGGRYVERCMLFDDISYEGGDKI